MSNENQEAIDMFDQLGNVDYNAVDTSMPLLDEQEIGVVVVSAERKTSKNSGNSYIEWQFKTTQEGRGTKGETVNPNYPIRHITSTVLKGNYDPRKTIAQMQDCFFGERIPFSLESFIGQEGLVRVTIEPEKDGYPAKNVIKSFRAQKN